MVLVATSLSVYVTESNCTLFTLVVVVNCVPSQYTNWLASNVEFTSVSSNKLSTFGWLTHILLVSSQTNTSPSWIDVNCISVKSSMPYVSVVFSHWLLTPFHTNVSPSCILSIDTSFKKSISIVVFSKLLFKSFHTRTCPDIMDVIVTSSNSLILGVWLTNSPLISSHIISYDSIFMIY